MEAMNDLRKVKESYEALGHELKKLEERLRTGQYAYRRTAEETAQQQENKTTSGRFLNAYMFNLMNGKEFQVDPLHITETETEFIDTQLWSIDRPVKMRYPKREWIYRIEEK